MRLNFILKVLIIWLLSTIFSAASVLAELQGTKGLADTELKSMMTKLDSIGFIATAKNEHIENHYYNKFKEKNLDLLSFYTITNIESMRELLIANPDFAAYMPFNLLAFKMPKGTKEGSDATWYGHLATERMLEIIGEKDEALKEKFNTMVAKLDTFVTAEMKPAETRKLTFDKPLPKQPLLKMVKKIGEVEDIEEYVEEFISEHNGLFTKNEFIIAGFLDVKFEYDDLELDFEEYDAFWTSSLCHFEFSNAIFNHGEPEAGLFAPCSVYFYIPKDSGELHVGYATVDNWLAATGITDEAKITYMKEISASVIRILGELGFSSGVKDVAKIEEKKVLETAAVTVISEVVVKTKDENILDIVIPTVPKAIVPKVEAVVPKALKIKNSYTQGDRSIKFSKRIPPKYISSAQRYGKSGKDARLSSSNVMVGDVHEGRISTYLRGNLLSEEEATSKLKNAGFEILAQVPLDKKKNLVSIVFSSGALKEIATKENKGHLATLRLLINKKDKKISITNPVYLAKAFLQDDFNKEESLKVLTALTDEFTGLSNSLDKLKFQLLAKYQFMNGMPYFKDHIVVARGDDLKAKLVNNKRVNYVFDLPNGATLIGVKLNKRTIKFPKKIGMNNAGMLPYPLLIENGEAKILEPKYYLSLMYPKLTMEEFMTIATVPDAIVTDCTKVFR